MAVKGYRHHAVRPYDGDADDKPDDEPDGGGDEASCEAGGAGGVEVEDGAGAIEDLAERLDLADELERAREGLERDGATGGGKS